MESLLGVNEGILPEFTDLGRELYQIAKSYVRDPTVAVE
jgi:hypothetical protein